MKRFRRTVLIAGPIVILYAFFLFLRASDDPKFCASCHYMEQYYNNWLNSSHNQVSCVKCHYAPGFGNYIQGKIRLASEILRYYVGAYSAEVTSKINDGACLQCHKQEDFYSKNVKFDQGKISFNHSEHLTSGKVNFSFKCQTCHSQTGAGGTRWSIDTNLHPVPLFRLGYAWWPGRRLQHMPWSTEERYLCLEYPVQPLQVS